MTSEHVHEYEHQQDGHPHGHDHGHDHHSDDMADLLELDAEVLGDYWTAALDWVRDQAALPAMARLLDLGAGTGTGALGLAGRFGDAEVIAVDVAPDSLRRLRAKAAERGLAGRVRAVEADLDAGWPDLGPLDLTWASMSLHHLADPAAALREVLAATRPDGMIAVAEFPEPLQFLPHDLGVGEPGFEDRAIAALSIAHTEEMPTLGSAWAPRLSAAGWRVFAEQDFTIDLNRPTHPSAARYARAWFQRLSHGLTDRLEAGDGATLAALLDEHGPHSLLRRADLHIRGIRTVTLARRG
jgi:SAM-dependent methyltransferase